jgi:RNA polymerase sigma-70 factor, ECF subfamily
MVARMLLSVAMRSRGQLHQASGSASSREQRVESIVRAHFAFMWRVARRFGLLAADADDAAQQVLLIASRRLEDLTPGKERAFLFRVTAHVATKSNRGRLRRREVISNELDSTNVVDGDPEQLLDQRQAREQLDAILAAMSEDLRAAFVLFEIEGFGQREIAEALGIPEGTVASRLRRAREQFTRLAIRHNVLPVGSGAVLVDWCDARDYCVAVGKRLCGRLNGDSASLNQWDLACTSGVSNQYPYGNEYVPGLCNARAYPEPPRALQPVGSFSGCQSSVPGFEGVFDLSGNVWEWVDNCSFNADGTVSGCRPRGGSTAGGDNGTSGADCNANNPVTFVPPTWTNGFRCCSQ